MRHERFFDIIESMSKFTIGLQMESSLMYIKD